MKKRVLSKKKKDEVETAEFAIQFVHWLIFKSAKTLRAILAANENKGTDDRS